VIYATKYTIIVIPVREIFTCLLAGNVRAFQKGGKPGGQGRSLLLSFTDLFAAICLSSIIKEMAQGCNNYINGFQLESHIYGHQGKSSFLKPY